MSALLTQSAQSGYIAGLLIGVAILGFILTLVVAGVYSIASNATFAQATRTGGVWAVGYAVAVVWTVLSNA